MDQDGRHLGGLILPGLRMMRQSLLGSTAIPQTDPSPHKTYFAQDTATAIDSGALLSTICLIERVAQRLRDRIGGEIHCMLTGGGAEVLKDMLDIGFYHEPNLVLQGLALVARKNEI
jgi:type III pantothenate kinase